MTLITQLIEIIQNLQQMHDEKLKLELTKDIAKILIPSQELIFYIFFIQFIYYIHFKQIIE